MAESSVLPKSSYGVVKAVFCEVIGTCLFVWIATASTATANTASPAVAHAFGGGTAYFAAFTIFYLFSGGHFNMNVTLAVFGWEMIARRTFNWRLLAFYLPAQYVGAILGVLLTWGTTGARTIAGLAVPVLGAGVSDSRGFVVELFGTTAFVGIFLWSSMLQHNAGSLFSPVESFNVKETMKRQERAQLLLFLLVGLIFVIHPITGASLSTTQYAAQLTILTTVPANWWVWMTGPLAGFAGALALVYVAVMVSRFSNRYSSVDIFGVQLKPKTNSAGPKKKSSGVRYETLLATRD